MSKTLKQRIKENLLMSIPAEQADLLLNHKNTETGQTLLDEVEEALTENPSPFDIQKVTGMLISTHLEVPEPEKQQGIDLRTALNLLRLLDTDDANLFLRNPGEIFISEYEYETVKGIKEKYDIQAVIVTEIITIPYNSGWSYLLTIKQQQD